MFDRIMLIVFAIIVSVMAWIFWHYLGEDAFDAFMAICLVVLFGDNYRLRKKLSDLNSQK